MQHPAVAKDEERAEKSREMNGDGVEALATLPAKNDCDGGAVWQDAGIPLTTPDARVPRKDARRAGPAYQGHAMADRDLLDRAFHRVLLTFIERGSAPHYTELARDFGLAPEAGRTLLHDLMAAGIPAWLHPSTELIASFAPFNNLPTHYCVSVDGERKWYAQCGFEAAAMCWIFPGKTVVVEAPCLDCGEPLRLTMRDGEVLAAEPETMVGYVSLPPKEWAQDLAFA